MHKKKREYTQVPGWNSNERGETKPLEQMHIIHFGKNTIREYTE